MLGNRRIAVIDDDEGVRSSLVALLRSFGCSARAYESAEACLTDAPEQWNCIISDINMPGTDGYQLLSIMRRRHMSPHVILMTGYAVPTERLKALDAGAACFLAKPAEQKLVLDCLTTVFGQLRDSEISSYRPAPLPKSSH